MKRLPRTIMTIAFLFSLLPMSLPWFGFFRGVQEISGGTVMLENPAAILGMFLFPLGLWGEFRQRKWSFLLGLGGLLLMLIAELYEFMTWHYLTVTGEISLITSLNGAYQGFYAGVGATLLMLILYVGYSLKQA